MSTDDRKDSTEDRKDRSANARGPQHVTHFDDCGCLTARYEARIAALEAELAEAREHAEAWESEADSANTLGQSWMAHANALRDALVKARDLLCEDGDWLPGASRAHECITDAMILTPAASLAAYRARVLEEAERLAAALAKSDCSAGYVATRIRALAAQEVKP